MDGLQVASAVIGIVGGLVGMIFGGLGIKYSHAANVRTQKEHEILLARLIREEEEREVESRKKELLRMAAEEAQKRPSSSTLREIQLPLQSELDRKAAWSLSDEGKAQVKGDACAITVDTRPPWLRNG